MNFVTQENEWNEKAGDSKIYHFSEIESGDLQK